MPILAKCLHCLNEFQAKPKEVNRGRGKFCSVACRNESRRRPIAQRFWSKVVKSEGCWLWSGSRQKFGYGTLSTGRKEKIPITTHRISWEIHNGPIPEDLYVLHKCDNPPCVRPDHLFLGTPKDNTQDMMKKSRHLSGEKAVGAKLTWIAVRGIRERYARGDVSMSALATESKVSQRTIHDIVHNIKWRE